jgi:hypothetical protein
MYYHYGRQIVELGGKLANKVAPGLVRAPSASPDHGATAPEAGTSAAASGAVLNPDKSKAGGIFNYGSRSPFFSVFTYIGWRVSIWLLPALAAAICGWLIWRTVVHCVPGPSLVPAVTIAALVTFGSTSWFSVCFVMPDIYAGLGILSIALLLCCIDDMGLFERFALLSILFVSSVFHISHSVIFAGILVVGSCDPSCFVRLR